MTVAALSRRTRRLVGLVLVAAAVAWRVQAAGDLTLGFTTDLPRVGLRFRPVEQITALPPPAPEARMFRREPDGLLIEAYDAEELWRSDQLAALFTNAAGRIRVAAMDGLPPGDLPLIQGRYVTREAFADAGLRRDEAWTEEALGAWVRAFTGRDVERGRILGRERAMPVPCLEFIPGVPDGAFQRFYVMRNPGEDGPEFVFFEFAFAAGPSAQKAEAAALGSLRSVVQGTFRVASEAVDPRFQSGGGVDEAVRSAPEYEAARRRVREEVGAMAGWWHAEMPHYLLVSNLEPGDRDLAKELQERIEAVREGFRALLEPLEPIRDVSVLRVFSERSQYEDYVGSAHQWTLGLWMPGRRELVISPVYDAFGKGVPKGLKDHILNTAHHEAWHQYAFYALQGAMLPTWFDEGHAGLFEACRFDRLGNLERIDENEDRYRVVRRAASSGSALNLDALMRADQPTFYREGRNDGVAAYERGVNYATAWALVYYLRKAVPVLHPSAPYADLLDRVVEETLKQPRDPVAAMDAALDGIDVDLLEKDFAAFWDSRQDRGRVERRSVF